MKFRETTLRNEAATGAMLRERELAEHWKTSLRTLQRWRADGTGPAFLKIGGAIRYRLCDVEAFEDRHRQKGDQAGTSGE